VQNLHIFIRSILKFLIPAGFDPRVHRSTRADGKRLGVAALQNIGAARAAAPWTRGLNPRESEFYEGPTGIEMCECRRVKATGDNRY
jgi:hypothetical protein